jgi:hypothetical protein
MKTTSNSGAYMKTIEHALLASSSQRLPIVGVLNPVWMFSNPAYWDRRFRNSDKFRFELQPSGCIHWMGATNGRGHAMCSGPVYRETYRMFRGPISEGMEIGHKCENGLCVHPLHLAMQTPEENRRDFVESCRKREQALFERPHERKNAKLRRKSVIELLTLASEGWTTKALSERFGVSEAYVTLVRQGKRKKMDFAEFHSEAGRRRDE